MAARRFCRFLNQCRPCQWRQQPQCAFQIPVTKEGYAKAGIVADPIGVFGRSRYWRWRCCCAVGAVGTARENRENRKNCRLCCCNGCNCDSASQKIPYGWQLPNVPQKGIFQAGIDPSSVDLFELHDAFTIMAALSLEACGFAERGKGLCGRTRNDFTA